MPNWADAVADELSDLYGQVANLQDEIDEWKAASGLTIGGDPADVTPEHLSKNVGEMDAIVREFVDVAEHGYDCERWMTDCDGGRWLSDHAKCTCKLDALLARVAALPKED